MKRLGLDYPELAKINPQADLRRHLGLRPDRPRRRPSGLCAGDPRLDRLRHGSSLLPAGPRAAGQLRHLRRRLCHRAPMRWAPSWRRVHQRHVTGKGQMVDVSMFETLVGMLLGEVNRAQFDFEMPSRPMYGPVEASDGYVMLATASETHLPGHGDRGRPARLADRPALREVRRPAHELGQVRRRVRSVVQDSSRSRNASRRWRSTACPARPISPSPRRCRTRRSPIAARSAPSRTAPAPTSRRRRPSASRARPAKRPEGGGAGRGYQERTGRSRPQRDRDRGSRKMIDPRTPILVGCGQITDTTGAPSSERSRVAFCAEAATLALDDTGAAIGGQALGHMIDAVAVHGVLQRHQPALRLAVRPLQQSAQERRQSAACPPAAAPLQPFRRQHAPVPGQPLRRGDRQRRDRAGADLRRRAAAQHADRAQGRP